LNMTEATEQRAKTAIGVVHAKPPVRITVCVDMAYTNYIEIKLNRCVRRVKKALHAALKRETD